MLFGHHKPSGLAIAARTGDTAPAATSIKLAGFNDLDKLARQLGSPPIVSAARRLAVPVVLVRLPLAASGLRNTGALLAPLPFERRIEGGRIHGDHFCCFYVR